MTDTTKYWLTDGGGTYAVVGDTGQRDRWLPIGWSETGEPTDSPGTFVMAWHADNAVPGRAPYGYFKAFLEPNGWIAGPPESAEHPLTTAQAAAESKPSKPAAGGDAKKE